MTYQDSYKKIPLFSENEYKFYVKLKAATILSSYDILVKVRLADFIDLDDDNGKEPFNRYHFRRISQKHVDYVIEKDKKIIALIELHGNEHYTNKKTMNSDMFKRKLFKDLGYKLFIYKNDDEKPDFKKILS